MWNNPFFQSLIGNILADIIVFGSVGIGGWLVVRYRNWAKKVKEGRPTTAPDGLTAAYEHDGQIYVAKGSGRPHSVTTGVEPLWSPDSKYIVYQFHKDGDWDVFVADPKTNKKARLTNTLGKERPMGWDAEGNLSISLGGSMLIVKRQEIERMLA